MSLELLGIIVNGMLAGVIALYVIWDHVKDDRLLTKQIQEFYEDIEKLIFYYYTHQIIIKFKSLYKDDIEFPSSLYDLNEYSNRHYYYMTKVKSKFKNYSNYLGIIFSEEYKEENRIEYINQTYIILTETGSLAKRQVGEIRSSIIKDFTQISDPEILEIDRYLSSLRNYWNKNFHKFTLRPRLKENIKFKIDLKDFFYITNRTLDPVSKEEYLTKGNLTYLSQNYKDSISLYTRAIDKDPFYTEALVGMGRSLIKLKSYYEALEKLDKALEIDPNYSEALYFKAMIALLVDDPYNAVDILKRGIEIDPMLKSKALEDFESIKDLPEFKSIMGINVFLSYSTRDFEFFKISTIAHELEKFNEIGQVLYWGKDMNFESQDIVAYLENSLRIADIFVLFASENSLNSEALKDEWQGAYQLRKKGIIKIIPVYEHEENIPYLLMPLLNVKFDKDNFNKFIEDLYREIMVKMVEVP